MGFRYNKITYFGKWESLGQKAKADYDAVELFSKFRYTNSSAESRSETISKSRRRASKTQCSWNLYAQVRQLVEPPYGY